MSFSQELIDTLLLPDGLFKLREHITIDPPQALAPPIGTYISLITIKSTDNQHKTPSDLVGPKLSALSLLSSGESVQDKQFSFLKKKRNSNASKSDSQFVAKLTVHDHLAATLASSIEKVYFFYNVGRAFAFGDLTWKSKV